MRIFYYCGCYGGGLRFISEDHQEEIEYYVDNPDWKEVTMKEIEDEVNEIGYSDWSYIE